VSTQIAECLLDSLLELSLQFKVKPLVKRCEEMIYCLTKMGNKLSASSNNLQVSSSGSQAHQVDYLPFKAPVCVKKIKQFLASGEHSDINIIVSGHGLVAQAHKLILSLWSMPFAKVHRYLFLIFVSL
jgi:hypothetical protein